jgi:hypothetical protein
MSEFAIPKDADAGIMRDAEDGIGAMIRALQDQMVPAGVMVDAALHILAAWEASRQSKFTVDERETCIEELMGMLPAHIDESLAAGWLPDAQGE